MNARRPSGAADRRRRVVARVDGLSPGRVAGGRHGRRIAEGPDAAAGPRLQRRLGEGAGRQPHGEAAPKLLGLAGHAEAEPRRLFSRTRRPRICCSRCAKRCACWRKKGSPNVFRAARSSRRGGARRGARVGTRDRLRGSARVLELDDGVLHARRARRRSLRARSMLEHFDMSLGDRPVEARRQGRAHRPSRQLQRSDARRHAQRHRDGSAAGGRAAPSGRRDGGARLARAGDSYEAAHSASHRAACRSARTRNRSIRLPRPPTSNGS